MLAFYVLIDLFFIIDGSSAVPFLWR